MGLVVVLEGQDQLLTVLTTVTESPRELEVSAASFGRWESPDNGPREWYTTNSGEHEGLSCSIQESSHVQSFWCIVRRSMEFHEVNTMLKIDLLGLAG